MNKADPIREQYRSRQEAFDREAQRQAEELLPELESFLGGQ